MESEFDLPPSMALYTLGFLIKGPAWTADETPEVLDLHQRHLAHNRHLFEIGKVVTLGPLLDNGQLRGVYIFRTGLAEAEALARQDPAVQAGRFILELHPWMVGKGTLPA